MQSLECPNPWFLTLATTKETLLDIPDLLPLINSFNPGISWGYGNIIKVFKQSNDYSFQFEFGSDSLQGPWGIAQDSLGNFLVASHNRGCICVYDSDGKFLKKFGKLGSPIGVAVDKEDKIYVSEYLYQRISCFDKDYNFLSHFGEGVLQSPYDVIVDREGRIVVANACGCQIDIWDAQHQHIKSFGKKPSSKTDPTALHRPTGVRVLPDSGNLLVVDSDFPGVQLFNPAGVFLKTFQPQRFTKSFSCEVDARGYVMLADFRSHRIVAFTAEGEHLYEFGQATGADISEPQYLYLDRMGRLLVSQFTKSRVSVYA